MPPACKSLGAIQATYPSIVEENDPDMPRGILLLVESIVMVCVDSIESINHRIHPARCELGFRGNPDRARPGIERSLSMIKLLCSNPEYT
jgi:hypothetical protein